MLETRKSKSFNENRVVTILGAGTVLKGELACRGTVRIEGALEGRVSSDDSVVLLDGGRVKGDIHAGQVIISGEVQGNIRAVDRLEITAQGKVIGDICAPRISIQEGVLFEGLCAMKPSDPAKSGTPRVAAPATAHPAPSSNRSDRSD